MNINKKNTYLSIVIFLILIIGLKSELVTINTIYNNNATTINPTLTDTVYDIRQNFYEDNNILDNIFNDNIDAKTFKKIIGKFIKFVIGLQVF